MIAKRRDLSWIGPAAFVLIASWPMYLGLVDAVWYAMCGCQLTAIPWFTNRAAILVAWAVLGAILHIVMFASAISD